MASMLIHKIRFVERGTGDVLSIVSASESIPIPGEDETIQVRVDGDKKTFLVKDETTTYGESSNNTLEVVTEVTVIET